MLGVGNLQHIEPHFTRVATLEMASDDLSLFRIMKLSTRGINTPKALQRPPNHSPESWVFRVFLSSF